MSPTGGSHLAVTQRRGTLRSSTVAKGRGGARRSAAGPDAGAWAETEKKGGRGGQAVGGEKDWAKPETERDKGNSFPFSKLCFPFSFKTKHISKPNLNSF